VVPCEEGVVRKVVCVSPKLVMSYKKTKSECPLFFGYIFPKRLLNGRVAGGGRAKGVIKQAVS
jgi:hypothetical protein